MHPKRLAAPLIVCVVAALGLPATAIASSAGSAQTGPIEHVLLTLTPQDRGALRALARSATPHGSTRVEALDAALPSTARQSSVISTARALGLTVDRTTRMSVLVSGPAARVRSLFGSARSVDPASHVQHPLPKLPSPLRGKVTVAFGGDDNRPAFRHWAMPDGTADGADFRTAYGDTSLDPLAPPSAAEKDETIATVQLSGWHASDLTKYADLLRQRTGNPAWPTPKYKQIVDPLLPSCIASDSNQCPNNVGDDVEVDLDQEAIYATAPYAHQRAYTSANSDEGMYDSLLSIGDDAVNPLRDGHIVAASISWGLCETDLAGDKHISAFYSAMEDALSYVLATGVTVFSSTGDIGAFCDGKKVGVGYPASSPQVVSVGGTQYPDSTATDPPQGWVDPGFSPTDETTGASAGGVSRVFPEPDYQRAAGIVATGRAVPDISAQAGSPGFDVVTSSPSGGGTFPFGGTSLSSPVVASTYALQVAQHGYSWGVGNILPGLYAQPDNFTDVDDGCAANDSTCPGWNGVDVAKPGYDEVTGLGTPKWSALVSPALGGDPHLSVPVAYTQDRTIPVQVHTADWQTFDRFRIDVDPPAEGVCTVDNASATPPTSVTIDNLGVRGGADGVHELSLVAFNSADNVCHFAEAFVFVDSTRPSPVAQLSAGRGNRGLIVHWGGGDSDGSGIRTYAVAVTSGGHQVFSTRATRSNTVRIHAKRGRSYSMTVTATDFAGNASTARATLDDDGAMSLSRSWHRIFTTHDYAGSTVRSDRANAHASARLTGRTYLLYVEKCPSCGKLAVFVNGRRVKTVDTYSRRVRHRAAVGVLSARTDQRRNVVVKVLDRHSRHSHGTNVYLDAVAARG